MLPKNVNVNIGRPGMDLWKILVIGTIKLNCNWSYDKLQNIVNNHKTIREMLGHGMIDDNYFYPLQTLRDNISLLNKELIDKINNIVVTWTQNYICKANNSSLTTSVDSFVVETNVSFPTDIKLLFYSAGKMLKLTASLSETIGLSYWRQWKKTLKTTKSKYNKVRRLHYRASKNQASNAQKEALLLESYENYIKYVEEYLIRASGTLDYALDLGCYPKSKLDEIEKYINYCELFINQIIRRKFNGETIPNNEKIISIFKEYTEWIEKGKEKVRQELGKQVCIIKDQYGLILNHQVMDHVKDSQIAIPFLKETKSLYNNIKSCSFDKGFWSLKNKNELNKLVDILVLPKRGRLSKEDIARERSKWFKSNKRKHSAVESSINALEKHGLDSCPLYGYQAFCNYVSLAVLSRNIQLLGSILRKQHLRRD